MFCSMCGKELKDGVRFCKFCGAFQQDSAVETQEEVEKQKSVETGKENKKSSIFGIILFFCVLAIVVLIVVVWGTYDGRVCERCDKNFFGTAYYDAFDPEEIMCDDCAKEYYAPFPYAGYKVK